MTIAPPARTDTVGTSKILAPIGTSAKEEGSLATEQKPS